jgi:hypothetical protein
MFEHIGDVLRAAKDNPALQAAREKAKNEAWMYRGEAGKRIADFMVSVVDEGKRKTDTDTLGATG